MAMRKKKMQKVRQSRSKMRRRKNCQPNVEILERAEN